MTPPIAIMTRWRAAIDLRSPDSGGFGAESGSGVAEGEPDVSAGTSVCEGELGPMVPPGK